MSTQLKPPPARMVLAMDGWGKLAGGQRARHVGRKRRGDGDGTYVSQKPIPFSFLARALRR
jgi:hypothetical protein